MVQPAAESGVSRIPSFSSFSLSFSKFILCLIYFMSDKCTATDLHSSHLPKKGNWSTSAVLNTPPPLLLLSLVIFMH